MDLRAGTSGFAYKEWKGGFYPEDLPERRFLGYYASQLRAVELNSTFYRRPKPALIQSWATAPVPADFRFVLKAPAQITHYRRLNNIAEPLALLLEVVAPLTARGTPLLFQLPPNFKIDAARLAAFLELLPAELAAAFEFRHPSWFDERVYALLRQHNAALCTADEDAGATPFESTADWGYLRLRRQTYEEADLAAWIERIRARSWREVYAFFKHEDTAGGPLMARRFQQMAAEFRG